MPRPTNTKERRSQIVEGLRQVMAENGYDGASIQAIARAAGLTPGLVHYHFENKQQILVALVNDLSQRLRSRYVRLRSRTMDPLRAFIDAHLALGKDADPQAVACWVAIGAEAVRRPEVREVYREAIKRDMALLLELVTDLLDGDKRKAAPVAVGLMSAIQGAYQLAAAAQAVPPGTAAKTIYKLAEGLIAREGGG